MFKKKSGGTDNGVKTVAERVEALHQVAAEMDRILNGPEAQLARFRVLQTEFRAAVVRKQSEEEYWDTLTQIRVELEQRQWEIPEPKPRARKWFRL